MKVLLIQVDGKLPNLALMKLSAYHKECGDVVGFDTRDPDRVYASFIFKKNKEKAEELKILYPNAEIICGGPGYDLHTNLPREIEYKKPDYSIYPEIDYSMGFTTRGCIRKCHFCVVPEKEGKLTRAQHPREFHDSRFKKIMLLDNNILADRDWFFEVSQWIVENNLSIQEHGMDIRLIDDEIAKRLKSMKWIYPMHFAFDKDEDEMAVRRGVEILRAAGVNVRRNVAFYVYLDDSSQFESGLRRCNLLKELGTNPFVMFNIDETPSDDVKCLRRWANRKPIFRSCAFEDYDQRIRSRNDNYIAR